MFLIFVESEINVVPETSFFSTVFRNFVREKETINVLGLSMTYFTETEQQLLDSGLYLNSRFLMDSLVSIAKIQVDCKF